MSEHYYRMEPSVLPSESRLRASSTTANPPSTSASNVLALSRTCIPSAVFSLRDMTDESINEVLLDKLQSYAHKPNENIDVLRAASARLHSRAASQDKNTRESTLTFLRSKKTQAILVLHTLLENVRDTVTATSVAGTIRECIAPKADKKDGKKKLKSSSSDLKKNHQSKGAGRISVIKKLIELNATQSIVKLVLCLHNREIQPSELLLQELIGILGVLAQKDHKFSVKTRLLNGVKVFHHLLRTHYYNHKRILSPLLLITIALAKNVTTTNILVKDGITTTLDKALSSFGYTPNSKLKLLLNVFFVLTKNSKFCSRMIKTGLVPQILKLFERWERYDGKMRIRICHFTLQTLGHLCNSRSGRHAICNGNGLALLYKFIQNCPDDAQHDPLLLKTCFIINACIERKELPVCTSKSPAQFTLPTVSGIDYNSSQNVIETDESGDESNDDYLDEDEENEKEEYVDEQPAPIQMQPMFLQQRDISELSMYNPNWCELSTSPGRLSQDRTEDEPNYTFKIAQNGPNITVTPIVNENNKSFQRLQRTSSLNSQDRRDDSRFCFGFNKKVINLKVFQDLSKTDSNRTAYCKIASRVRSVLPFVKVAYPDMDECSKLDVPEPLFNRDRKAYRAKLLSSLDRNMYPSNSMFNVVYDMDQLVASNQEKRKELSNWDEERVGLSECSATSLQFESRFESGNLRKAIQVGPREYDLVMMPDVNSNYHHNWFYFEVSNMDNLIPYTLNIINFDKPNSQFNFGMKPLLFSVKEAVTNKSKWVRAGEDICYFKNTYSPGRSSRKKKALHTVSFTIQFPHNLDVCYIAYHFPYTYSKLLFNIWQWSRSLLPSQIYLRVENLCNTLNNNETPVITVTSADNYDTKVQDREIIFLTSRIHPGETNSSWVMHGSLDFLLSDGLASDKLRSKHIIKVVPMLNPEGVINGCYRCGLSDEDLNRKWREPDPVLHPTIYHTKGLMDYSCRVLNKVPYVFCDYHGHSRRKNVFLFGCSMPKSWNQNDFEKERDGPVKTSDEQVLPKLLASIAPAFDFSQCSFVMEHSKETTARITVWREFNVTRSYTMESSYCGFDVGAYKGNHMNICHLEEMGGMFCAALVYLSDSSTWSKRFNIENIAVPDSMTESGEALDDSSDSSDSDCSDN